MILLWPFFFLALAVVGLKEAAAEAVDFPRTRALWLAFWELRGLKVDFQTATGPRVFLWIV